MTLSNLEIRSLSDADEATVMALHQRVFGPGRFARTAYRIREGSGDNRPDQTFSRIGWIGTDIAAAVTMTPVTIGGEAGVVLLGPLVVAPEFSGQGLGEPMVNAALDAAKASGIRLVVLVGDQAYYKRFGFMVVGPDHIRLPGPVNAQRVLAVELIAGSLSSYSGIIEAQSSKPTT